MIKKMGPNFMVTTPESPLTQSLHRPKSPTPSKAQNHKHFPLFFLCFLKKQPHPLKIYYTAQQDPTPTSTAPCTHNSNPKSKSD